MDSNRPPTNHPYATSNCLILIAVGRGLLTFRRTCLNTDIKNNPVAAGLCLSIVEHETEARAFIYLKESTNRIDAKNSIGCIGLVKIAMGS